MMLIANAFLKVYTALCTINFFFDFSVHDLDSHCDCWSGFMMHNDDLCIHMDGGAGSCKGASTKIMNHILNFDF